MVNVALPKVARKYNNASLSYSAKINVTDGRTGGFFFNVCRPGPSAGREKGCNNIISSSNYMFHTTYPVTFISHNTQPNLLPFTLDGYSIFPSEYFYLFHLTTSLPNHISHEH